MNKIEIVPPLRIMAVSALYTLLSAATAFLLYGQSRPLGDWSYAIVGLPLPWLVYLLATNLENRTRWFYAAGISTALLAMAYVEIYYISHEYFSFFLPVPVSVEIAAILYLSLPSFIASWLTLGVFVFVRRSFQG